MTNKVLPIKPSEVAKTKMEVFPDEVLEAFNELIAQNFSGNYARFTVKDVINLMTAKGLNSNEIRKNGWLNVEEVYQAQGWKVRYESPDSDQNFAAYFIFGRI